MDLMKVLIKIVFLYKLHIYEADDLDQFLVKISLKN